MLTKLGSVAVMQVVLLTSRMREICTYGSVRESPRSVYRGGSTRQRLTFEQVVRSICSVHEKFAAQAARSVNMGLTLRNWLIGMYIVEFELRGADRAKYGEKFFDELATMLNDHKVSGCKRRQLYNPQKCVKRPF